MKKVALTVAVLALGLAACDKRDENAADAAVDNALDSAGNAVENAGEAVENAGEAVEDAADNAAE